MVLKNVITFTVSEIQKMCLEKQANVCEQEERFWGLEVYLSGEEHVLPMQLTQVQFLVLFFCFS